MIELTENQQKQKEFFSDIFNDHLEDLILYPIVDKKTGDERLGLIMVNEKTGDLYLFGLLFLEKDKLYNRFYPKEMNEVVFERPPSIVKDWLCKMKNRLSLLWN